jgi:tetratricopeptide (TPR) repeat protein
VETLFEDSAPFGGGPDHASGALVSVPYAGGVDATGDERALEQAVARAAERLVNVGMPSLRACRDSRAALRPSLAGNLRVQLSLDGDGSAHDVKVAGTSAQADDAALNRCMEVALAGMRYPASGLTTKIKVDRELPIPVTRASLGGAKCSSISTLPLPLRRGIWRARLQNEKPIDVYVNAKRSCELNDWAGRRALLELVLLVVKDGIARVDVARALDLAGETEAAAFLKREAVRRAETAAELNGVKTALIGEESYPRGVFQKRYRAANDDEARLDIVRKFLGIAPHDGYLRNRLFVLLEALGKKSELREEARRVRLDPFASAELRADVATSLRRNGDEDASRRTFGELCERAPADPWARAFLGDRLRNEGWFDDAVATYSALEELSPSDPAATIRLALAHAGAGRLDIARRLLTRVVETGGRVGNAQAGDLAGHVAASLLGQARGTRGVDKAESDALTFAALEVPRAERRVVVLIQGPAAQAPVNAKLWRTQRGEREEIPVEITAATMGLYVLAFEPGDADVLLVLSRADELPPTPNSKLRIDALVPSGTLTTPPELASVNAELVADGKPIAFSWTGDEWQAASAPGAAPAAKR